MHSFIRSIFFSLYLWLFDIKIRWQNTFPPILSTWLLDYSHKMIRNFLNEPKHETQLPLMCRLCSTVSLSPSKRAFSAGGNISIFKRTNLQPENLNKLLYIQQSNENLVMEIGITKVLLLNLIYPYPYLEPHLPKPGTF